jgi:hypothetical protein
MEKQNTPRQGWEDTFRIMHINEEDVLLIPDVFVDEIALED